jgi:hypothetical protein
MGQRVNIHYSIDLNELELEVDRMIKQVADKLERCEIQDMPSLTLEMMEELSHIRTQLADIDHSLADVVNIISSYINYKTQPETPPETEMTEEAIKEGLPDPRALNLDQLESLIGNFKKSSEANEVSD